MFIKNVTTQAQRNLYRKVSLNGPFIEVKSQKWYVTDPDDSEVEVDEVPNDVLGVLSSCSDRAIKENTQIAEAIVLNKKPHIVYIDPLKRPG